MRTEEEQRILNYMRSRDDWAIQGFDMNVRIRPDFADETQTMVYIDVYYEAEAPPDVNDFIKFRSEVLERIPPIMNSKPFWVHASPRQMTSVTS